MRLGLFDFVIKVHVDQKPELNSFIVLGAIYDYSKGMAIAL